MKRDVQKLFNKSLLKHSNPLRTADNLALAARTLRTGIMHANPHPQRIAADMPSRLKMIEECLENDWYKGDDQKYALEANIAIIRSGKPIEEVQALLKGAYMGLCNISACQEPVATWFNRGTDKYYCQPCAFKINGNDKDPLCYRGKKKDRNEPT